MKISTAALATLPFLSSHVSAQDVFCSPEGEKSITCGGQEREGRAQDCCPGLVCGGEQDKVCVPPRRFCGMKDERAKACGAGKSDAPDACCPGFKCQSGKNQNRCEVDRDYVEPEVERPATIPPPTASPPSPSSPTTDTIMGMTPTMMDNLTLSPTERPTQLFCAGYRERAQDCGAGSSSPNTCCPGFKCQSGKNNIRCEVDRDYVEPVGPTTSPTLNPTVPPPSVSPTLSPTAVIKAVTNAVFVSVQQVLPKAVLLNELTEYPSYVPSSTPSLAPTPFPSEGPTSYPTNVPTFNPTVAPTITRRDECKLEMYYRKEWCWHDDRNNSNCKEDYKLCIRKSGDEMEMEKCGMASSWSVKGRTIRYDRDKDYCWTRSGDAGIRIRKCSKEEGSKLWELQQFEGVCMNNPEEIHPLGDKDWCLTQGHEPRPGERLKFQNCEQVRRSHTNLWLKE